MYVAADEEELKQQLDRYCNKCGRYEAIDIIEAKDGEYVIIAVKVDKEVAFSD